MLRFTPVAVSQIAPSVLLLALIGCGDDTTEPIADATQQDTAERPDARVEDVDSEPDVRPDAALQDVLDTDVEPDAALPDVLDADSTDVAEDSGPDVGPAPTVTVSAPTTGEYIVGTPLQIRWDASDADTADISLVNSDTCSVAPDGLVVPDIASLDADAGVFTWDVPTTVATGNYRIRVVVSGEGGEAAGCSEPIALVLSPECEALGCAEQNRACESSSGRPACSGCVEGYAEDSGTCTLVDCGPAPVAPANGSVSTPGGTSFTATATYSCATGYSLAGEASLTCLASGTWSGSAPTCSLVDCGPPPGVTDGSRTFTSTTFASTASYASESGFARSGAATLTCDATGTWGTAPVCNETDECTSASVCTAAGNVCTNTRGSWLCSCAPGFIGASVTGGNASCTLVSLGNTCTDDSECPSNAWCSDVSGYNRCSPRVFGGTANEMDFVFVPGGTFQQGTTGASNSERPFTATITRNFFVGRTEVTQGQWRAASGGTNPSCFQSLDGTTCTAFNVNDSGPVENMDWYSALAFANAVSVGEGLSACYTLSGCSDPASGWHDGVHSGCTGATFSGVACTGYRLPTESEWELATRIGGTSEFFWGNSTDPAVLTLYCWYRGNAGGRTQATAAKFANPYGLFDVSGNVWEWVWDWYAPAYPETSATDYTGPATGTLRGIRGGSWDDAAANLRGALRNGGGPTERYNFVGLRLVRTAN